MGGWYVRGVVPGWPSGWYGMGVVADWSRLMGGWYGMGVVAGWPRLMGGWYGMGVVVRHGCGGTAGMVWFSWCFMLGRDVGWWVGFVPLLLGMLCVGHHDHGHQQLQH